MKMPLRIVVGGTLALVLGTVPAQAKDPSNPTWWDKYQYLAKGGSIATAAATVSTTVGKTNVNVSNECGPQSETYITLDPNQPNTLAAGSNEIFRLPMRGYFSSDGGGTSGDVEFP